MPRKTKKQKILARLHRLEQGAVQGLSSNEVNKVDSASLSVEPLRNEGLLTAKIKAPQRPTPITLDSDYSYMYKDLRKIFVLTFLALGVEIFLSLTASNSYAKLVLRTLNLDF